ncbi:MAG: 16S rRNA (cytidine(1402)-2'-O)-methyltransferase [Dehalococcoidales bacterium]|nr:MAG: 16S rRNA (cytidine(1402)-2'-O)-methyltransferase [Dehalococcoidales bacterium]
MPTLYVVATPIGNLEDISLRALRILREVKLIAAEDTRKTKRLLNKYDIKTTTTSYYEHNKLIKLDYILDCLGEGDVALVSEAGMPGISDPGYELIKAAGEKNIPIVPVPGASAVVSALSVSGLPTNRFTFLGFLPRKSGDRNRLLNSVESDPGTLILLESPHRLKNTLEIILNILGDRKIAVCRELTKMHEEVFRSTISEAIEHFTEPRGEFTLIVEGAIEKTEPQVTEDIQKQLNMMRESGLTARESIRRISEISGLSRKELYRAWLKKNSI